ncbi:MAG TPA: hypothetical protein PLD20_17925 [Blastocatellia bacterium]|nr:hypothetical protein [Blastocatellia bacterium]HMX26665.1 hypothetical protein [Blastocatellia bacterium]HMZ19819.1 hypothetical protein [Blastocatellia bacterium]
MSFLNKKSAEKPSKPKKDKLLSAKQMDEKPNGKPSKLIEDKLISAKKVAELLGISVSAVHQGKAGTAALTRIKLSQRCVRWSESEVLKFIQRRLELARSERFRLSTETPRKIIELNRKKRASGGLTKEEIDSIIESVKRTTK